MSLNIPFEPAMCLNRRLVRLAASVLFSILALFFGNALAQPQAAPAALTATPSAIVLAQGESAFMTVVDQSGLPVPNAEWSISEPIAELHSEDGELSIE